MQSEQLFGEFQLGLAALVYKTYLDKISPGQIIAEQLRSGLESIREIAGAYAALLQPEASQTAAIKEVLNQLGDQKVTFKELSTKSDVRALATAIFREILQANQQ